MIYLDTSALLKLVVAESESDQLAGWLEERSDELCVTSDLTRVELLRAVMRREPTALLLAQQRIARLHRIPLRDEILTAASTCLPPALRSLDAIHLASARSLRGQLKAFVVYDHRLFTAATEAGLDAVAPGQ
ncbi:MAG: type II toxin-antitoxin system VapC family toxin [Stackebrandtia sp.]